MAELWTFYSMQAGYQTPQNNGRVVNRTMAELWTFYSMHLFCGVRYPAEQCPAGSDTLLNKIRRGIRPCGTKSCRESNSAEQHWKTNVSANSKKNSKIFYSRVCIRGLYGVDSWKKPEVKISCYCPFNTYPCLYSRGNTCAVQRPLL